MKRKVVDSDDEAELEDSDDEEEVVKEKKVKKVDEKKAAASSGKPSGDGAFELGSLKKITVGAFKGKTYINIREFYTDKATGEEKPGKKGIALTVDQWEELKKHIDDVDSAISAK